MYQGKNVTEQIYWIGSTDRRLNLFENMFPIPEGINYNSYLIDDEKTAVLDTVDSSEVQQFIENIEYVLKGRTLDYLIINHMEPDHCAGIGQMLLRFPNVKIVGNKKTFQLLNQFYDLNTENNIVEVKENDVIALGKHSLKFFMAPMVHWPEVMVSFEENNGILFSADIFGSFGAFEGEIFSDAEYFSNRGVDEYRRYYSNIVGKYGLQAQNVIKKLGGLNINTICPLHGSIWKDNIDVLLEKYNKWSLYMPEEKGVVIAYASMYGNTENAANILANKLSEKGVKNIKMYDVSKTNVSYIISDVFKLSHFVVASPTYNNGLYPLMENLLLKMESLNVQNRNVGVISNGSWAPAADKKITEIFERMKNMNALSETVTILSSVKEKDVEHLCKLADDIAKDILN